MDLTASDIAALVYMIILQYILLKIHRSKAQPIAPSSLEIFSLVSIAWIFYGILETAICYILNTDNSTTSTILVTAEEAKFFISSFRGSRHSLSLLHAAGHIFYISWTTWILSRTLAILSDRTIPLLQNLRQDPQKLLLRFRTRCQELIAFFRTLNKDVSKSKTAISAPTAKLDMRNDEMMMKQIISLERRQDHSPTENERVLIWKVLVDKNALDEMKGALGPPGGFGELGFNVAKDQVCFGAMGIGTSFNLTFELERSVDSTARSNDGGKTGGVKAMRKLAVRAKSK